VRSTTRVLIIPGLAVRRYVLPAAAALDERGIHSQLLPAPGSPDADSDLREYGLHLARQLEGRPPVDLLVGLSVGAQAAAVTAMAGSIRRLMLVSPTVDVDARSAGRLLGRFLAGSRLEPPRLGVEQAPDWLRAGRRRLQAVTRSALRERVEDCLPQVNAEVTIVHAECDAITSHDYAAWLAAEHGARLVLVPGATHSWPYADEARFADTVEGVLR
jgi:Alpha/beta hydrolase family